MVPIYTQLKEELGNISEEDQGVKTLKRKLDAGLTQRLGHVEEEEWESLSASLDPRFGHH